jgi:cytochrome c-type biogenesis protein CcmH/NrfG
MLLLREKVKRLTGRLVFWSLFLAFAFGVTYFAHRARAKAFYAVERLEAAQEALDDGDVTQAQVALKEAVRANPRLVAAYDLLAATYDTNGDPEKALAQREAAVEANPNDPEAHHMLASIYVADKRHADAISELHRVLELDPDDRISRHLLARCYIWNGQPNEAIQVFEALMAENPGDEVARRGLAVAKERLASAKSGRPGNPVTRRQ